MWQQRLGSRVASVAISPSYRRSRGLCRVGFDFKGIIANALARPLSYLALSLPATSEKWQFRHELSLQQPRPWLTHRVKDVFLAGADGRGSPWFNNLNQLRHHSSSFAPGRGGRKQNYTQVGGPIVKSVCDLSEEEIHNLIHTRNQCRQKRDFQRADSIREQLKRCGVEVDDRAKTWRADGKLFMPRMSDCRTLEEAIKAMHAHLDNASPRDMSAFWTVVPRFLNSQRGRQQQPLVPQLGEIFKKTADRLGNYGPRDLVTTALAFAKIIKILEKGRGRHVGGSYEEFLHGILVVRKDTIFKFIGKSTIPILSKIEPRYLSNLAYACALAGHVPKFDDGSTLFHHLAERSIPLVRKFIPQGISNMIWAFATAEVQHPLMFKKIADHIFGLDHLDAFKPQELSNVMWAFAKSEMSHPPLFEKAADHIVKLDHLDAFIPQTLSNTVWAYAKAEVTHLPLFDKVANHIVGLDHLGAFDAQNLANTIWAYAKAEMSHPGLFGKIADHIVSLDNLEDFTQQNIKNLIWGFAKADVKNLELFDKLADVALDKEDEFTARDIANILRWTK